MSKRKKNQINKSLSFRGKFKNLNLSHKKKRNKYKNLLRKLKIMISKKFKQKWMKWQMK